MTAQEIIDAMSEAVAARNCFIVNVKISRDSEILLTIESEEGAVDIDDCVALSRIFEEKFDREAEDYGLTVSSAGLDQPFKVLRQYLKAVGSKVEVQLKGGRKFVAELLSADEGGVEVKYSCMEAVEGRKRKESVEHVDKLGYDEINSVRYHIEF